MQRIREILRLVVALMVVMTCVFVSRAGIASVSPGTELPTKKFSMRTLATSGPGYEIFKHDCAQCHESGAPGIPSPDLLQFLRARAIIVTLTAGQMRAQGSNLSVQQKQDVAEYLSGEKASTAVAPPLKMCSGPQRQLDFAQPPPFAGWGLSSGNTHFIPNDKTQLRGDNVAHLKLRWAFAYPDGERARSQPTPAGGALYVGGDDGTVYAIEQTSGCIRWTFQASAEVRTAVVVAPWRAGDHQADPLAYFGDVAGGIYAVSAKTGILRWRIRGDDHPATSITGAPLLVGNKLYVPISSQEATAAANDSFICCTFRGSLLAVNARTGALVWKTFTIADPPSRQGHNRIGIDQFGPSGAAVWGSPTFDADRNQIYIGTSENYSAPATATSDAVIAIDAADGRIKWSFQGHAADVYNVACLISVTAANCPVENGPDFDFGAGMMIVSADGKALVIGGEKSGEVYALDPDTGRLVWHNKVGAGSLLGGVHFGMAAGNGRVYVPINDFDDKRPTIEKRRPGLYALKATSGEYVWKAPLVAQACGTRSVCHPGLSAAISATSQLIVSGGTDGRLRIHDAGTGALLWQFDTTGSFRTVSGELAHGGSMSGGSAPIVLGQWLFVNSGYAYAGLMPGNVLLAFEIARLEHRDARVDP